MLIDPFVVIAQIINFLILVALLKRFLYKPITEVMEARSQRIELQLAAAANKEADAETEKKLYLQKQQALETQKQEWLNKVKQEVELEKGRLTESAIAEINSLKSQWYKNFEQDRQKLAKEIRDRLSQQVSLTTRKTLLDLANADLEEQIVEVFIARLYNLDDTQLKEMDRVPLSHPHVITIRSSFTIPEAKREPLINAVRQQLATNAEVQFEIEESLICGIELRDRGYKISWNIQHYLTGLETATAQILDQNNSQQISSSTKKT